mmetsp:Transcript_3467/g.9160  ORF Transcript_3467/g.9160 Transcript_3467/m.9160 type:complete len:402 (+) Transcript_3467:3-1208(+)
MLCRAMSRITASPKLSLILYEHDNTCYWTSAIRGVTRVTRGSRGSQLGSQGGSQGVTGLELVISRLWHPLVPPARSRFINAQIVHSPDLSLEWTPIVGACGPTHCSARTSAFAGLHQLTLAPFRSTAGHLPPGCPLLVRHRFPSCLPSHGRAAKVWATAARRRSLGTQRTGGDDLAAHARAHLEGAERRLQLLAPLRPAIVVENALAEERGLRLQEVRWVHRRLVPHLGHPHLRDALLFAAKLGGRREDARLGAVELALDDDAGEGLDGPVGVLLQLGLQHGQRLVQLLAKVRLFHQALVEESLLLLHQLGHVHLARAGADRLAHPLRRRLTLLLAKLCSGLDDARRGVAQLGLRVGLGAERHLGCAGSRGSPAPRAVRLEHQARARREQQGGQQDGRSQH